MIYLNKKTNKIEYEQISFLLGENYLITFQEKSGNIFENLQERIEKGIGRIRKKEENYLAYALFDIIVDNYFLILEDFEEKMEILEDEIIKNPSQKIIEDIMSLKKEISKFKRNVMPIKEILTKISNVDYFDESMSIYLKDLHDHGTIIYESIEIMYNRSNDLIQLCHSSIGNNMNEIMRVLTTISTIFIPLSFLAGVYGMNFQYMPELSWEYGYYFILILMFMVVIGIILAAIASFLYLGVCLGSGPRDGLMIALQKKTNKSVRLVRTILEILALVVGWLLGGSVGIGTLVSALGLGYVLQIVFRIFKFDTKLLKHRFIIDDIREWKEKKNEEHKCKSSIVIKNEQN